MEISSVVASCSTENFFNWSMYPPYCSILHCANNQRINVMCFFNIYYHKSLYDPILSVGSITSISQVHSPAKLALLIVENWKYEYRVVSNGITSIPNLNPLNISRVELSRQSLHV